MTIFTSIVLASIVSPNNDGFHWRIYATFVAWLMLTFDFFPSFCFLFFYHFWPDSYFFRVYTIIDKIVQKIVFFYKNRYQKNRFCTRIGTEKSIFQKNRSQKLVFQKNRFCAKIGFAKKSVLQKNRFCKKYPVYYCFIKTKKWDKRQDL